MNAIVKSMMNAYKELWTSPQHPKGYVNRERTKSRLFLPDFAVDVVVCYRMCVGNKCVRIWDGWDDCIFRSYICMEPDDPSSDPSSLKKPSNATKTSNAKSTTNGGYDNNHISKANVATALPGDIDIHQQGCKMQEQKGCDSVTGCSEKRKHDVANDTAVEDAFSSDPICLNANYVTSQWHSHRIVSTLYLKRIKQTIDFS